MSQISQIPLQQGNNFRVLIYTREPDQTVPWLSTEYMEGTDARGSEFDDGGV